MKLLSLTLAALTIIASAAHAEDPAEAAWKAKVGPRAAKDPAFAYVKEDPSLPRVLIIGDSISIGYTATVRELLKGKANVLRIPVNASSTDVGVAKIDEWLGSGPWAVIHFNWGLHDLKHMKDGKLDAAGPQVSTLEVYEKNLRTLVKRLKQTNAKLIWAATTPVPEGSAGRDQGEEKKYNAVAAKVMQEEGVTINDLAGAVTSGPAELQRPKNVHFTPAGDKHLGQRVADAITKALGK